MLTFLVLLALIMPRADSTVKVEKFSGTPLPSGHHLDPANLIKNIQPSNIVGCSSACKGEPSCQAFSLAGTNCMIFDRASVVADANAVATTFFETASILLVRHDHRGGEFFPAFSGSWALNKDDENAELFSRLDELDDYLGSDGKYHFK